MFLASLSAVHEPAQVTRGGFHDRPIIHIKLGALTLTCSVDDARELAANLLRAANEATPITAAPVPADGILRGNADLVPAQHATLETPR